MTAQLLICLYLENLGNAYDLAGRPGQPGYLHATHPDATVADVRAACRRLVEAGLVAHEHHGREQWWALTRAGEQLVEEHITVATSDRRRPATQQELQGLASALAS